MKPYASVEFRNISFTYGKLKILNEITVSIPEGQIFGILGANGAGKTTLMRLIVGLLKPESGSLQIFGENIQRNTLNKIGYMPQLNALYNELSVAENVHFFARMYGISNKHTRNIAVDKVLSLANLDSRRNDSVAQLSGGMKQRVSLATAMVHSPELLVLDEPTVGLDPRLRNSFWEYFESLARDNVTILISSHAMDDATRCHRLIFLHEGHIVADGSPEDLKSRVASSDATLEEAFLHFVTRGIR